MKAKKSLGQNFLKSEPALRKIIEAGEIKKEDVVLEIGPGKGALTKKLLERAGLVIAVEKDRELFEFLQEKFAEQIKSRSLVLVHEDILKIDTEKVIKGVVEKSIAQADEPSIAIRQPADMRGFRDNILENFPSYKIIANIPYNITGAILKKFLTANPPAGGQPELMVLLLQKEVAQRIVGRGPTFAKATAGKKESVLSISVKAYGEPKMIMKVPARYFSPAPKVDSAVIAIKNISRKLFTENKISEEKFWQIVKTGFAHKRKKLSSNLKNSHYPTGKTCGVELGNKRAEELSLSDWIALAKSVNINTKE